LTKVKPISHKYVRILKYDKNNNVEVILMFEIPLHPTIIRLIGMIPWLKTLNGYIPNSIKKSLIHQMMNEAKIQITKGV